MLQSPLASLTAALGLASVPQGRVRMEENAWITGLIMSVSAQMDTVGGTANKVSSLTVGG